ncbi:MAG: YicC family protein [Nitrospiraceae bacterium]|nr:YicC family protein [Nitrospiraceae bacterium]
MTGFGSAQKGDFKVEIRSLNSKHLEINMRLPHGLVDKEAELRGKIKEHFSRGKFDVFAYLTGERMLARLNAFRAKEVYIALDSLRKELLLPDPVGMAELIGLKELFVHEEHAHEAPDLLEAFEDALVQVKRMRLEEGRVIKTDVSGRLDEIGRLRDGIEALLPAALENIKAAFVARMKAMLAETGYDESRVLHEASVVAEKADIAEEVTRISGYTVQIGKLLGSGDKIGRELDFILQELNREANTICSKTVEMEILNRAILLKSEVERIRQQIQNLQ